MKNFHSALPFALENGAVLPEINIAYYTYGELNPSKDNVLWICHALTGSADVADWWQGLFGEGKIFDPNKYFIVCANMLGSCYGTTSPAEVNKRTGKKYGADFPMITIRDMAKAFKLLSEHLGIQQIKLLVGGSTGGQQACEWAILEPKKFENLILLATNAKHSSWGIAFNESQRMAIQADKTLYDKTPDAGKEGLKAARAIAMLSYRNYQTYGKTQSEETDEKFNDFRASSYQQYQGNKLWERFDVWSYYRLSQAMDSQNVGRRRGGCEKALASISAKTLVIGIQSDVLFPVEEQIFLAKHIPNAQLEIIESIYGHDGFLVETEKITALVNDFLNKKPEPYSKEMYLEKTYLKGVQQFEKKHLPGSESF